MEKANLKVLIVDDDMITAKIACHMGNAAGLECVCTHDIEGAEEMVKKEHYPLIMLDVFLHRACGHDALKAIRNMEDKLGRSPSLIVGVSGHRKASIKPELLEDFDDYHEKPYTTELFQAVLDAHKDALQN